jgi:hypothetical protein
VDGWPHQGAPYWHYFCTLVEALVLMNRMASSCLEPKKKHHGRDLTRQNTPRIIWQVFTTDSIVHRHKRDIWPRHRLPAGADGDKPTSTHIESPLVYIMATNLNRFGGVPKLLLKLVVRKLLSLVTLTGRAWSREVLSCQRNFFASRFWEENNGTSRVSVI